MIEVVSSNKFEKDLRIIQRRGYNMALLRRIIDSLQKEKRLSPILRDHLLSGDYSDCRECHVKADWLLIYQIKNDVLYLLRTGTHSDLFR
ncbi:MAG: type II toxin-antitoxin system YafQ family toxin [Bacilli bacterium]|nr:type II toxin-antitoxin system YafQ family toxin [Bacilli bacterium]